MQHTHPLSPPRKILTLRSTQGAYLLAALTFRKRLWGSYSKLLISLGIAVLLCGASPAVAQTLLGTAQSFAVLGASAVTNTGPTVVTGDLGVSPGSAVTGFPPGIVVGGTIHVTDAVATQARNDAITAYNALAGLPCNTNLTGQDLGGLTLTPGVYCFASSAQLTGTLMLDAQGDPNAVFVFQIGTTLTTAAGSSVIVKNGAQACNVFWQIGSSATVGTNIAPANALVGTFLSLASVTLQTGANIIGRVIALNGAVTMDTNTVTRTSCAPSLGVTFSPVTIPAGGVATKTITLINPNSTDATLTAPLTDTLPAGLVIAAVPNVTNTCGGVVTANPGGNMVTLTGGMIPGGAPGSCTVTVDVTAAAGGNYVNSLPAGALQTSNGSSNATASATLTVVPPGPGPPLLGKAFTPAAISAGGASTLTITLINPNPGAAATLTAPLIDTLPAGVVIAAVPNAMTTCGGVVTATPGGNMVTLTGGVIPAGAPGTCTVTVNVTAPTVGNYINTLPANALQTSNGNNADSASATLTVVLLPPVPPAPTVPGGSKPGSVLVFPYYTSSGAGNTDTRITISNIGDTNVIVHLFLIDGTTCQASDFFLCLTPHASFSFKASEFDPEVTGWVLAVAVDQNGNPIQNNVLIGNAFVQDGAYRGNYGATAFAARSAMPATLLNDVARLNFNGFGYDPVPAQLAVEIQSPLDAVGQRLVTVGLSGDLNASQMTGAGQTGTGMIINGNEQPLGSFVRFLNGSCQAIAPITATSPRVPGGMNFMIPKGQVGTMQFRVGAAVGLLMTPQTATWNGIRSLHQTGVTNATITIPVIPPSC